VLASPVTVHVRVFGLLADIPCFDEDNSTLVKFIDRHNGWGLTALHLATYKGSSSTGEQWLSWPCL
jgi:hypothetical protein